MAQRILRSKRILITGVAGSIGSELCRQLYKTNKIFGIDLNESGLHDLMGELEINGRVGDIRDKETIHDVFSDWKPQIVFHAAALKHVDFCEKYPEECTKTNVNGTENLLTESRKWECVEKFVFISTDKVNGNSVMGATKKLGEIMTKNLGYTVVRFGNVIGSRGSLFTIWDRQIEKGDPITVTDTKMERYFMSLSDACELVIKAAETSYGLIALDMGKLVNIYALAKIYVSTKKMPNYPIKITGIRAGEVLEERLMSEEEEKRAIKKDKFFLINGS